MTKPMVRIYTDLDVFVDREMTDEEFAQHQADQIEIETIAVEEAAKKAAKAAVLAKLGLTEDEAAALLA